MVVSLNRSLLVRQLLAERVVMDPVAAVEHLVGLQSQNPLPPYVGLWSRLAGFSFGGLAERVVDRSLVRLLLMRGTIHLVSARDAHLLRPVVQPVLDRSFGAEVKLPAAELPAIYAAGREHVVAGAVTGAELAGRLAVEFPHLDGAVMATAVRARLPLVQVPPRGVWGRSGPAAHVLLESWVGAAPPGGLSVEGLVRRYLGAFGPATPADAMAWSGLSGLGELFEGMGLWSGVVEGRRYFDLPEAPRVGAEWPAPVRLVADFDNLVLSHADRSRVISDEHRRVVVTRNGIVRATVLVDGRVAGVWRVVRSRGAASVVVSPFGRWGRVVREAVVVEGLGLLGASEPGVAHEVVVESV